MGQFHEEAIQDVATTYFGTPGDFYVGLINDTVTLKTDGYADITEVTGSGYALIALTTLTIADDGSDNRTVTGNEVTFAATGTWAEAKQWIVIREVTSGSYILVASNGLTDGAVTLQSSESVKVEPIISLNG